jgi:hypothetical protein
MNPQAVTEYLGRHPFVGASAALGGTASSFVEQIEPLLRVSGLVVGLAIGVITLMIKFREWKQKSKASNHEN